MRRLNFFLLFSLLFVESNAYALTATCKSNIERFNAALLPFSKISGMGMSESIRHTGWAAQEMAYAAKHGCEPGRHGDERAQLQEFENTIQDTVRLCQQVTTGGDCSPKQGAAASSYRRPDFVRPFSEGMASNADGNRGALGSTASSSNSPSSTSGAPPPQRAVDIAQQNQARAERQRMKDKRRKNFPELDASDCLTPIEGRPGFSGYKNNCPYPVQYTYCVESPRSGTGAAFVDCSKQSGAGTVPAGGEDFAHMRGGERVHHVACKAPGTAVTRSFEGGRFYAECAKLGGD